MALRLGDEAPDFTADTTEGSISFHDWLGDSWGVLFSHPKDFTPVCTTELGLVAGLKEEFDRRNVKVIGLSVDTLDNHDAWASDIKETQGQAPNFPIISDADRKVSDLYDMIHPNANDTLTVPLGLRHRPRQEGQAHADLPGVDRAQLQRDPARDRQPATHREPQGRHAGQLETGRRRDHRPRGVGRRRQGSFPPRVGRAEAVSARGRPARQVTPLPEDFMRVAPGDRGANPHEVRF